MAVWRVEVALVAAFSSKDTALCKSVCASFCTRWRASAVTCAPPITPSRSKPAALSTISKTAAAVFSSKLSPVGLLELDSVVDFINFILAKWRSLPRPIGAEKMPP